MTHGVLTEPSVSDHRVTHDRKGREGKGRGIGSWLRSIHDLRLLANATLAYPARPGDKRMAAVAALSRGVR